MTVLRFVRRNPFGEKGADVVDHHLRGFAFVEKVDHGLIKTCERAQCAVIVWVGEVSDVKDKIGHNRNAVLEGKALKGKHHV